MAMTYFRRTESQERSKEELKSKVADKIKSARGKEASG
jgi:hypothetical protein